MNTILLPPLRSNTCLPPRRLIPGDMPEGRGITLYTAGTPNGWKASILIEELGVKCEVHPISLSKNEQKEDWFIKINPNARIPAIVDHDEGDLPVFESGAIMMYLADKHGKLLPRDSRKRAEVISWLMFQMGGLGPMQGQASHFIVFAPERVEYGINRYKNEVKRLYRVIEDALSDGRQWLAAGEYSIADIANFSWMYVHFMAEQSLDDLPHVKAWMERIASRPAVQRGLDVPDKFDRELTKDPEKQKEMIEHVRSWNKPKT